jgi:hypothetical protein
MTHASARIATVLGCFLAIAASQSRSQTAPPALIWESSESATAGIQVQIVGMWDAIHEMTKSGTKIGTRKATLKSDAGASVRSLMQSEGLYVGGGENYPRSLDLLFCELNSDKCTVRMEKGVPAVRWTKLTDAEVLIPDLRLQAVEQVQTYKKKRGDRLSTIVVEERMGCAIYDAVCSAKVKHLNPNQTKLKVESEGWILVPATGYQATIPLAAPAVKDVANGAISEKLGVPRDAAERFIKNVIVAPAAVKANADEKLDGTSVRLGQISKIIRYHPLERSEDRILSIGLVDSQPDLKHCAFNLSVIASRKQLIEYVGGVRRPIEWRQGQQPSSCGPASTLSLKEDDHGTHLLGLWFADKTSSMGSGMLPLTDRTYVGIANLSYDSLTQAAHYADVGRALAVMGQDVRVVNMSWGVSTMIATEGQSSLKPRRDNVGESIARFGSVGDSPVLFVASAGNEKRELGVGACDITPTCGPKGRRNVLTVTALTNDEKNPDVTANFGRPVDIGVPAVNVLSTLRNHLTGRGSGSSQAAAVASAAASMLMYGTGLRPQQARNRLIYTSDLTPLLVEGEGKLFGGRLNFERAAGTEKSWIAIKGPEQKADVSFAFNKGAELVVIPAYDKKEVIRIPMSHVKRLFKKPGGDNSRSHTIFYTKQGESGLSRVDGVLNSKTLGIAVFASVANGGPLEGKLGDVLDYTAPVPPPSD